MKFVVAFCLMILCSFMSVPSTTNVPATYTFTTWNHSWATWQNGDGEMR